MLFDHASGKAVRAAADVGKTPVMLRRVAAMLGIVCAATAVAQKTPQVPAAASDVVVVGNSRSEIDREARRFIESIIPTTSSNDPMPRFEISTVCPIAIGLTPALDAGVTDRMRQVAAAAAVPLDKPGCRKPSALVLFADDLAPTIAMLEKRYVGMFIDEYGMPIHFAKKGPVVVWHVSQRVNQNGEYLSQEESGGFLLNRTSRPGSRIEASSHRILGTTIVLIERRSVEGLTVTQVADYAAMRAFADTRPPASDMGGDRPPSILSAIEAPMGSAVPASLTKWDLGFLRGLYSTSVNLRSSFQRGEVASAIARDVSRR